MARTRSSSAGAVAPTTRPAFGAQAVASRLGTDYEGRATPMLKETRAPAIVVEAPDLDEKTAVAVVDGIDDFFRQAGRSR